MKKKHILSTIVVGMSFMPYANQAMQITDDGTIPEYTSSPITIHIEGAKTDLPLQPQIQLDGVKSTKEPVLPEIEILKFEYTLDNLLQMLEGAKEMHISQARDEVTIEFEGQPLEAIIAGTDSMGDYVVLKGITPQNIDVLHKDNLQVKIFDYYVETSKSWTNFKGDYINQIDIENKSYGTEITLNLLEGIDYALEERYGSLFVRIGLETDKPVEQPEQSSTEIKFDTASNTLTLPSYMQIHNITDNYREREIIIDLGGYYPNIEDVIEVNNSYINNIQIVNEQTTKIVINENIICTYILTNNGQDTQLKFVRPQEKYDKIVMIDTGHGGSDPGAVANNLMEKEVNTMQAMAIKEFIEQYTDIKVYMTREEDVYLSLLDRTSLSNEIQADLFISIHNNAATTATATGTEIYYYPNETNTAGKTLAQNMVNRITSYTGMHNRGAKAETKYVVLKTSGMPAILLEGGFLTNASDAQRLGTDDFTKVYALAVYESIVEFFNMR
ncbi:MAG: hypothetical protein BEN19_08515 [Epulopiscium sp. Nuni2H_MBin003]|nr:MAG: hypothetical protein BEN19_08515 [Epulopiscium sp. Nuni2H_MBin003]